MTNTTAILICLPLCILTLLGLVITCAKQRRHPFIRQFSFLVVMIFCWQLSTILYHMTTNDQSARVLYDLKIPFVAFTSLALFLYTVKFYQVDRYVSRGLVVLLSLIPVMTTFISITSPLHTYLRQVLVVDTSQAIHTAINIRGAWFWIHTATSYLLILISTAIALFQHRRLPRAHRPASVFLITAVLLGICSNLLELAGVFGFQFDFTLVGMSVAALFMFAAMDNSAHAEFLILARNEIYNFMEESIFILDNDRAILDTNRAADRWIQSLDIPADLRDFGRIIALLENRGARVTSCDDVDVEEGIDLYLSSTEGGSIFNMRERPVHHNGSQMGYFVTLLDVTRNRMHINRLEETAGVDALTGLPNRRSYQKARQALDRPECLPLTVILGDLNGLKEVNDTLGHHEGDHLLQLIAATLAEVCPPQGEAFRLGGDEFLILIPGCTTAQAQQLVRQVNKRLDETHGLPARPSIALGYAVKERPEQDLESLVQLADRNMYSIKRSDQRSS